MKSTEKPEPDDPALAIMWRLRDSKALERQLEVIFGDARGLQAWKHSVLEAFAHALQGTSP